MKGTLRQSFKMANLKHRLTNFAHKVSGALPFTKSEAKEVNRAEGSKTRSRTGAAAFGYKASTVLSRSVRPRGVYTPHQGEGEKARRRAQIAKGMIYVG